MFEVFLIFLIVLASYASLIYDKNRSLNWGNMWYQEFKIAGYEVSKNFVSNLEKARKTPKPLLIFHFFVKDWYIKKNGLEFIINLSKNRNIISFRLNFNLPKYLSNKQSLRIEKRGAVVKLLDWNTGEYSDLNEDFAVYGSNLRLVEYLFNNRINLRKLNRVMDKSSELNLEMPLVFSKCRDVHSLIELCDDVNEFVDMLKSFENSEIHEDSTIKDIIDNIRMDLINLECVICYQKIELNTSVILNCCTSIGHEDHISLWLNTKDTCPYCRRKDMMIIKPQEIWFRNE